MQDSLQGDSPKCLPLKARFHFTSIQYIPYPNEYVDLGAIGQRSLMMMGQSMDERRDVITAAAHASVRSDDNEKLC